MHNARQVSFYGSRAAGVSYLERLHESQRVKFQFFGYMTSDFKDREKHRKSLEEHDY
jgi:hypothetical protein